MNKYCLKTHVQQVLEPFASTLKATSHDRENGHYLCNDTHTPDVYDFDAYVQKNCLHPIPASPDAIHTGKKDLYFIEFKNQRASEIDKAQMQRKFMAGTQILKGLLQGFGARDCKYHFCVVMKNQPRSKYMDFRHVEQSVVKFGLDELNKDLGGFYDHIVTESLDFYLENFRDLQCA